MMQVTTQSPLTVIYKSQSKLPLQFITSKNTSLRFIKPKFCVFGDFMNYNGTGAGSEGLGGGGG